MKKIRAELKRLRRHGYYYRMILTPYKIDLKIYKEPNGDEVNYLVNDDEDGRYTLYFSLQQIEKQD